MYRTLLVLLLVSPAVVNAQSLDLRGFGGTMMNSGTYQSNRYYEHSKVNALGGLGLSYRTGHFEFGMNLAYRRYSFRRKLIFADQFDPATGLQIPGTGVVRTFTFKEPAIAIAPLINYHFGTGRWDWFAGLSPAYVRYTTVAPTDKNFELSQGLDGFSIDAQVGCSYEVLPRLRAYAEITGGSAWLPYFKAEKSRFFNAGLNLGAQFRLWERPAAASVSAQ